MGRSSEDEGGAVAVIVAIFMAFTVLGLAAVSIDLGSLWSSQRSLVTDTDAMALAGAMTLAQFERCDEAPNSPQFEAVEDAVVEIGADNGIAQADIELTPGQLVQCVGQRRIVEVRGGEDSEGWFSGREDLRAGGVTAAEHHRIPFPGLSFCKEFIPDGGSIVGPEDIDDHTTWSVGDPVPANAVIMPYGTNFSGGSPETLDLQDLNDECYSDTHGASRIPGGWGWLEQGANWEDGAPFDCDFDPSENWCLSDTGTNELNLWEVENGDVFTFPVFDAAAGTGGGGGPNPGRFRVIGIGQAQLVGCSSGSQQSASDAPFVSNCRGSARWMHLIPIGYEDVDVNDMQDLLDRVYPPPRICGVSANDGHCIS